MRTATSPTIDGVLDDAVWADALVLELKYETRPAENGPAPVRTRVLLAYDADALYVAFDAEDPDPSRIRARLRDRDRAYDDDFVGIVVDPFDDHLRAFEFFVNPLGVQMDLFQDDVTHNEDDTWDAIWDSAGQVSAKGYAVEMAIPMRALRFTGGGGEQLWGFDIIRMYPRAERYRISVRPNERGRNCYLCQNIHLRGFEGITPGNNLEVVPAVVAYQSDSRPGGYGTPMEQGELDVEPSIDVRWGVTPNVMLNGTLNLACSILSYEFGIGVRNGCFCAHPYILHLLQVEANQADRIRDSILRGDRREVPGLVRMSFGLYNTTDEIDVLIEALERIRRGEYRGTYIQDLASGDYSPQGWQVDYDDYFTVDQFMMGGNP